MSSDSDGETDKRLLSTETAYDVARRWYHAPVLLVVMAFMFWTRYQNHDAFTRSGGGYWLQAVDSWYHWRATNWVVDNYPQSMGYDPWTGFPEGAFAGQFGALFDQIVATVAVVVGAGNPTQGDVLTAVLVTVPALAALVAVPTYYVGKRVGNRLTGLLGVVFLSLTTGTFFIRTTAGMFEHHVAEALFMTIAVLAMMVAVTAAEDERPIWELVVQREWDAIRRSTFYSLLAGLGLVLYLWTWPPGVVLIGIFGVFFVLQLTLDFYGDQSPDHVAFVGVVSMVVTALGAAARIQEPGFSAATLNYFAPTFALLVAGGCVFLAWLARQWESRALPRTGYPAVVGLSILGSLVALRFVLPGVFGTLIDNITGRLVPFGRSASALTVEEVGPPDDAINFVQEQYGYAFFTGVLALPVLVFRSVLRRERRAEHLLVAVWTLFLISMGLTQTRFNYYLAVGVAVLNAAVIGFALDGIELPETPDLPSPGEISSGRAWQVAVALVLVGLVLGPLVPPFTATTPIEAGSSTGASPDAVTWEESLTWLSENTPELGKYGGANNTDALDYDGTYQMPADDNFEYGNGTYGVMSWWDYGHLITVKGNRIPHANPFQQNARTASSFFTAQSEQEAELYLDAIAAGGSPTHSSNKSALRETVAENGDEPGIQYVMIDDESAAGKFSAIATWTGPPYREYVNTTEIQVNQNESRRAVVGSELYRDSMMYRLYMQDGESLGHYRLVHETPRYTVVGFARGRQVSIPVNRFGITQNDTWEAVENSSFFRAYTFRQGGNPAPELGGIANPHVESEVKVFGRVEGATITGEAAPNTTVSATVGIQTSTGRPFGYEQTADTGADGTFELTVSYPTSETLGPAEGYANASVRAQGNYTVTVQNASGSAIRRAENVTVSERAIQTGGVVEVSPDEIESDTNGTDTNGTDGNGTVDNGTDGNGTVDNGTDGNGTVDNSTDGNGTVDNGTDGNETDTSGTNASETNTSGTDGTGGAESQNGSAGQNDSLRRGGTEPDRQRPSVSLQPPPV